MDRGKGKAGSGETLIGGGREGKAQGGECCGGWSWDMLGKCGGRASGKAVNPHSSLKGRKRKTPREGGAGREMMGGDYRLDRQVHL